MRVLFLATYFPKPTNPTMGVWALKEAQQLQRAGANVRVVSLTSWIPRLLSRFGRAAAWANCPKEANWDGLFVEYPRWPFYQVGTLKELWIRRPAFPLAVGWQFARRHLLKAVSEWKPDVVFAHHGAVNGYVAERVNAKFNIPYVVKDYDYYEIEESRRFPGRKSVYQLVSDHSSVMLSASVRMKQSTEQLFPQARIIVHHNGADPIPTEILHKPRPDQIQDKTVISSGGIFYNRKAMPLLVSAFVPVARRHPHAVLRIFGDGHDRLAVESLIRENRLEHQVKLLGLLPHRDVLQELVWSDFFALVGWDEPFATVYLEAMAAGKPIVCSNDGGINDVFVNGTHGLSVPPRDQFKASAALDRMVADRPFRLQCGSESKSLFVRHLSATVAAKKLFDILTAAAERRPIVSTD